MKTLGKLKKWLRLHKFIVTAKQNLNLTSVQLQFVNTSSNWYKNSLRIRYIHLHFYISNQFTSTRFQGSYTYTNLPYKLINLIRIFINQNPWISTTIFSKSFKRNSRYYFIYKMFVRVLSFQSCVTLHASINLSTGSLQLKILFSVSREMVNK